MVNNTALQANNQQKQDIEGFFRLHFPDSEYRGKVHLWAKSRYKNARMYRLCYGSPEQLLEKLENSKITSAHQDYYITANTMSAGTRDSDGLFSLNNIVLDIDNHAPGQDSRTTRHQYGALVSIYQDILMDGTARFVPNTIVFTGRGCQLWFNIEQIGYKRLDVWQRLTDEIIKQTDTLIIDHKDILTGLSVDTGASRNAAGLYRAPWSYNRKSGTYAEFEIIHDDPIDAMDEVQRLRQADRSSRVINFATAKDGEYQRALKRQNAIINLVKLRMADGQTIQRDNVLFCIFCNWSGICQDAAEIMTHVKAVNALFDEPMQDREIKRAMSTATRKRYQLTNDSIIKRLKITTAEREQIQLFAKGTDREIRREAARQAKADRNKKILSMYAAGSTQEQIADSLSISRRTVCNVLEQAGARKCDALRGSNKPETAKDDKKVVEIKKKPKRRASVRTEGQEMKAARVRAIIDAKMCKNRPIYCGNNAPRFSRADCSIHKPAPAGGRIIPYPPTADDPPPG